MISGIDDMNAAELSSLSDSLNLDDGKSFTKFTCSPTTLSSENLNLSIHFKLHLLTLFLCRSSQTRRLSCNGSVPVQFSVPHGLTTSAFHISRIAGDPKNRTTLTGETSSEQ